MGANAGRPDYRGTTAPPTLVGLSPAGPGSQPGNGYDAGISGSSADNRRPVLEAPVRSQKLRLLAPVLVAAAYFGAAMLGRRLSLVPGQFVAFWLPSGVYLAVLLRSRMRDWPLLVAGAVAGNVAFDFWHGQPLAGC
jgi:MASE1